MNDTDSPDYRDHNLGDERETPEEKEISRLQTKLREAASMLVQSQLDLLQMRNEKEAANRELTHRRAESLRLVSANEALEKERDAASRNAVLNFAGQILHGDQEHRNWLNTAAVAFVKGEPLPEPNGKGRAEAAEAKLSTAQAAEARLRGEVQRIADDFHPIDDNQAPLALREMRDALTEALTTPPTAALPDDGSDLIPRGLLLEIKITVDNDFNVTTINRGAPCRDFSKMERAYLAARAELDSFITRGPQDCPLAPARAAIAGATK